MTYPATRQGCRLSVIEVNKLIILKEMALVTKIQRGIGQNYLRIEHNPPLIRSAVCQ